MVVTLGQQFTVGEKPTVILYTYIVVTKRYQGQRVCDTGSLSLLYVVCMYGQHFQQSVIWINWVRLPILHVVS